VKKYLLINIIIFSFFCKTQDFETLILNKWELEEITDTQRVWNLKEESQEIYYINFFSDNYFEAYLFGTYISGKYILQTSKNKLILEEDIDSPPILFEILELTSSTLVLSYREEEKPVKLKFSLLK
jgi:hypothetical protein